MSSETTLITRGCISGERGAGHMTTILEVEMRGIKVENPENVFSYAAGEHGSYAILGKGHFCQETGRPLFPEKTWLCGVLIEGTKADISGMTFRGPLWVDRGAQVLADGLDMDLYSQDGTFPMPNRILNTVTRNLRTSFWERVLCWITGNEPIGVKRARKTPLVVTGNSYLSINGVVRGLHAFNSEQDIIIDASQASTIRIAGGNLKFFNRDGSEAAVLYDVKGGAHDHGVRAVQF